MSDDLGFPHNHEEIAWSHFLAQHLGKEYTEGFVKAFYPPLNVLDKSLSDLYTLRWLDTAVGVQLDGIGTIVGIPREIPDSVYLPFFGFLNQASGRAFGVARMRRERDPYAVSSFLGDEDYRLAIIGKIAANNSHGTAEDIMTVCNAVLGVTLTSVFDMGNATAWVFVNDLQITEADYRANIINQVIPRAGGVKIFPFIFDFEHTFGFANQEIYFGFNDGILARSIPSNVVVEYTIWDGGDSIWDGGYSFWDWSIP